MDTPLSPMPDEETIIPNRLLGVPTHPYPIYDIAMNLAIVAIIWGIAIVVAASQ